LKQFKCHGDAALADLETVKREQKHVHELIDKYGYELWDIFNMDETGLFYAYVPYQFPSLKHTDFKNRLPPDRGLSDRKRLGVKGQKVRLTYVFTSNADGSEETTAYHYR
jgi:hypothetical protein